MVLLLVVFLLVAESEPVVFESEPVVFESESVVFEEESTGDKKKH